MTVSSPSSSLTSAFNNFSFSTSPPLAVLTPSRHTGVGSVAHDIAQWPVPAPPAPADNDNEVQKAVDALNADLFKPPLEARYSRDEASKKIVIRLVDTASGEVLRQLPNEAVVRLAAHVAERQKADASAAAAPSAAPHLLDETA